MGRGEESLLCDSGSELRLGEWEKGRAKIVNGMKKKGGGMRGESSIVGT